MGMTTFESDEKLIASPQKNVFDKLSDLHVLEQYKDRVSADKLKGINLNDGVLSFPTPMGDVSMKVAETTPCDSIRFESVQSPMPFNIWIKLQPASAHECHMKVVAGLEGNSFLLGMVQKPLKDGLNRIVEALAKVSY